MTVFVLACLAGVVYRLGGYGPPFNTKWRDLGIPALVMAYFTVTGHWHWSLVPCFLLLFGAQTSYFKRPGQDATAFNWFLVGLAFSFALLPYAWAMDFWAGFGLRMLVVTGFTVAWSCFLGQDWIEEGGRGAIQIITLPLLVSP